MKGSMLKVALVVALAFATTSAKWVDTQDVARADATPVKVYITNYNRAETHVTMAGTMKTLNITIGKIFHFKLPTPVLDNYKPQVVRMNRDTLYSNVIFDLWADCATVELPPTNNHYMSLYAIDEEQYSLVVHYADNDKPTTVKFCYKRGGKDSRSKDSHSEEKNKLKKTIYSKTRYVYLVFRTLANPNNLADLNRAWALQNAVKITQKSVGEFVIPQYDLVSLVTVRYSLAPLSRLLPPATGLNGFEGKIDPTIHLIGSAALFAGLPKEAAAYEIVYPTTGLNTAYIQVPNNTVPIDSLGFWSVTVYNATGLLPFNTYTSYSWSSITATPEADGSIIIYFSPTKTDNMKNWLLTYPGWNYMVRMYKPLAPILDNTYHFPALTLA